MSDFLEDVNLDGRIINNMHIKGIIIVPERLILKYKQ